MYAGVEGMPYEDPSAMHRRAVDTYPTGFGCNNLGQTFHGVLLCVVCKFYGQATKGVRGDALA